MTIHTAGKLIFAQPAQVTPVRQCSRAPRLLITKGTFEAPTLQRGTTPNGM